MKIELNFDEGMIEAITKGWKCCTFRRTLKGGVGDTFVVAGKTYRIVQLVVMRLCDVLDDYYGAEGFDTSDEMAEWASTQYGKDYDRHMIGYVHFFASVPAEAETEGK